MRNPVLTIAVLTAVLGAAQQADASTLYGVTGAGNAASSLYTIDLLTGAGTYIGDTGFSHVTGLDFDPTTGVLYGHVNDGGEGGFGQLITINPFTGAGTLVGDTLIQSPDMSFNAAGQLYAWGERDAQSSFNDKLLTIDKTTGAATLVGGTLETSHTGLAFDTAGTLYLKPGGSLYTLDPSTGAETFVTSLDLSLDNALAFDPDDNQAYSILRGGGAGPEGGPALSGVNDTLLEQVDVGTGTVTSIGFIGAGGISALAFQPSLSVPEASTLVPVGLASVLGIVHVWRRRKTATA
jgi:hypothetical protein